MNDTTAWAAAFAVIATIGACVGCVVGAALVMVLR